MASNTVEWPYTHDIDNEGAGKIIWQGIIYQLSVADEAGEKDKLIYYSVRLDGNKSCFIGTSETDKTARELIFHSKEDCK